MLAFRDAITDYQIGVSAASNFYGDLRSFRARVEAFQSGRKRKIAEVDNYSAITVIRKQYTNRENGNQFSQQWEKLGMGLLKWAMG